VLVYPHETIPGVPEAFLARFPVAAYVVYCDPREERQAARCVGPRGSTSGRFLATLARKKKSSGTQGNVPINSKVQHPPRATPRAFELLKIDFFKFPPLGAKKPFKCPTNYY